MPGESNATVGRSDTSIPWVDALLHGQRKWITLKTERPEQEQAHPQ
jgi:hypothetical protein